VSTTVPRSHAGSQIGVADVRAQLTPLPPQLTQFVGRGLEVAEIRRILSTSRLVTLTGIGGSGKTRLAVEVAGRSAHEWGGAIAWVDLAPLSDGSLLARHVAAAMGLGESLDRSPMATLVQTLCPLSVLLVLDN
jgi:predicted ATPase